MKFIKEGDIYKVARITGTQDNILGISLAENDTDIEIVEWNIKEGSQRKSSSHEVFEQVLKGLKKTNEELGKNYKLSKIYFLPTDSATNSIYQHLITEIIKRIDGKGEFIAAQYKH